MDTNDKASHNDLLLGFFHQSLKNGYMEAAKYILERSRTLIPDIAVCAFIDLNSNTGFIYLNKEIQGSFLTSVLQSIKLSASNYSIDFDLNLCDNTILPSSDLITPNGAAKPTYTITVPIYTKVNDQQYVSFINISKEGALPPEKKQIDNLNSIANLLASIREREIKEKNEKENIERVALKDELTGVYNRHSFYHTFNEEIDKLREKMIPLSLLLIDIDEFKHINDKHGHAFGDMILKQVTSKLTELLDPKDRVYRIGGDEFAVILKSDKLLSFSKVQTVLKEVSSLRSPRISLSGGLVEIDPKVIASVDDAVQKADKALYLAKGSGKNQVLFYDEEEGSEILDLDKKLHDLSLVLNQDLKEFAATKLFSEMKQKFQNKSIKFFDDSKKISDIAVLIGKDLKLKEDLLMNLRLASYLKDVGLFTLPDEMFDKKRKPDAEEIELYKNHPVIGGRIIQRFPALRDLLPTVLYHHEMINGKGFPYGLSGNSIPLDPRIIAVAEAFYYMHNDNPLGRYDNYEKNLSEMIGVRGIKYDSQVLDALLLLIERREIDVGQSA